MAEMLLELSIGRSIQKIRYSRHMSGTGSFAVQDHLTGEYASMHGLNVIVVARKLSMHGGSHSQAAKQAENVSPRTT
jgi:hypothetical protein